MSQSKLIEPLEVTFGCFVDSCDGIECVLDGVDGAVPSDCDSAELLFSQGLDKTHCEYWKPILVKPALLNKCPHCGHEY